MRTSRRSWFRRWECRSTHADHRSGPRRRVRIAALAAIKSVAYFGVLLATALVTAVLSDLIVVPALLVKLGRS